MPAKDLKNDINVLDAFSIVEVTTDTTTTGNIIDMQGYQALTFIFQLGTLTDGTYTPLIRHGDDSGLSDVADVADAQLIGTELAAVLSVSNTLSKIGYVGYKRYVRSDIVSASTSSGAFIGAIAIQSAARHKKVS